MIKKIFSILGSLLVGAVFLAAVSVIILYLFNYHFYAVKSGSMEPTIHVGSLVLINENDTELDVGDIAMYQTEAGSMVTHRVISVYPDGYQFRGDANNTEDIEEISQDNIIGTYVLSIPKLGYIFLNLVNLL